jgi:polyphosphate kinase 2 (PPK2 family)
MIQLFNRSHYEDILVTRVHNLCDKDTAEKRMRAINDFEWLLQEHNNTIILKFYLHISEKEQAGRLQERLDNPAKQWKYNEGDLTEAKFWPEYRKMNVIKYPGLLCLPIRTGIKSILWPKSCMRRFQG